jgi:hypothetical protein
VCTELFILSAALVISYSPGASSYYHKTAEEDLKEQRKAVGFMYFHLGLRVPG